MQTSNILRFHRLGRMPMLMLAAGVLALALVAIGGATAKRADAATNTYTFEVSFESLRFTDIDDGVANNRAELYGFLEANGNAPNSKFHGSMIGTWGNPGVCGADWTGSGQCYKRVDEGVTYFFSQTPMCNSSSYAMSCSAPYATNNNKVRVTMSADPTSAATVAVGISISLNDYDSGSSDDLLCARLTWLNIASSKIPTLDQTFDMHDSAHDGDCTVRVRVRRV